MTNSDIGRTLAEPAHEVRKPFAAERNVDAHAIPRLHEHRLQIAADAVQHLELESIGRDAVLARDRRASSIIAGSCVAIAGSCPSVSSVFTMRAYAASTSAFFGYATAFGSL